MPDTESTPVQAERTILLLDWRPLHQNTLRGFARLRVDPPGLVINDVPVHRSADRSYALLPGKPQLDREGRVLLDDRGKRKYSPILEIPDEDVRQRFSAGFIALIQRDHPEALT